MALSPEERERLLAGLPENIRQAVVARMHEVDTRDDFNALKRAEELEALVRPLAALVQAGDNDAFGLLWDAIRGTLRGTIRGALMYRGDDHFREVESRVMQVLWKPPAPYIPNQGPYMKWASSIAHNAARWYRPRGAGEEELNDVHGQPPHTELPPPACYLEVLKLVQDNEPHVAVAFLFNKYLGWTPKSIVTQFGDLPLPHVLDRLEQEVVGQHPDLRGFGVFLAPLRKQVENGDRTLSSFFPDGTKPEEAISRWTGATFRALSNLVIGQEGPVLSLACRLRAPSYERLSFLWCRFLRKTPYNLASLRELLVMKIFETFCAAYLCMTDLSETELSDLVLPLRDQIFPKQYLRECEREDLCSDIARWRDRVQSILLAAARAEQILAYAYLCGCLPGLTGSARRNKKEQGDSNDAVRKSSAHG